MGAIQPFTDREVGGARLCLLDYQEETSPFAVTTDYFNKILTNIFSFD
jgi:hypothetical protein